MLLSFRSNEKSFFDSFAQSVSCAVEAARELQVMLTRKEEARAHAAKIKDIEHKADAITHDTVKRLHKYFVTNLGREDILGLITKLDDVVDFIDAAASRLAMYEVKRIPAEMNKLAEIGVRSCEHLQRAILELPNMSNSKDILEHSIEVNRLENEADDVLRHGLAKLFKEEPDERELIKLKEIFELLETVTDRCEDVANRVDGIVLEYA